MTWTDPDHTDEEWVQPWEDGEFTSSCEYEWGDTPEFWMAFDEFFGVFEMDGSWTTTDFYAERPRWVSDR